ncbi:hypothetical protein D3C78_1147430 [compost metagenome]
MAHQAGADQVVLHPVAGAADVEVHLVIAGFLGHPRAGRQLRRHAAAELQGQRMLGLVVAEIALAVAMQQRAGGDHLGVEQSLLRQQAQEEAAVAVGPVHHGRSAESPGDWGGFAGGTQSGSLWKFAEQVGALCTADKLEIQRQILQEHQPSWVTLGLSYDTWQRRQF